MNTQKQNRKTVNVLKSGRYQPETEQPMRTPYLKLLREYSGLKKIYAIDPYVEVYKFRDNVYGLYSESLDGMGDPWMYLIDGPKKAMLIDTAFGLGNLKELVNMLTGGKELIVANTHSHFDHAYGNAQFDEVFCSKAEVPSMKKINNPHIWDYLFDEQGKGKWAEFDKKDLIDWKPYKISGVEDNHLFDLGEGYLVELIPLHGHTPGQSGYYDHQNKILFCGDLNAIGHPDPDDPFGNNCTVQALAGCLKALQPLFNEIKGVFPGHGMTDLPFSVLQNTLDACTSILENPDHYDSIQKVVLPQNSQVMEVMLKNIYQGSAVKYTKDNIYKANRPDL